ncbi:MAG: bifunctional oligoribonuclease/PAP phosphatase NrnA [Firmicutes bacterium]|nr:bifunctional oligoribonuclease/PAP phosphatase NrnA [Bacillota bacterium]
MTRALDDITRLLGQARSVLLAMHVAPDGDSAGSALALGLALKRMGHEVRWVARDPVPERLRFLPGAQAVVQWDDALAYSYDAVVALDCASQGRLGAPPTFWSSLPPLVNIDHHLGNPGFGTINWVDSRKSSTGEMVAQLFRHAGWQVTADEALCLWTAMSTDTLSFRQRNANAATLGVAHWLVESSGLDVAEANRLIWDERPLGEVRFLGWALSAMQVSDDRRFAWVVVSRRRMEEFNIDESGVDATVYHLLSVNTVEVAFLVREMAHSDQIKISWRGKAPWNVAKVAQAFGGGGHVYAAAAVVTGKPLEVVDAVIAQLNGGGTG